MVGCVSASSKHRHLTFTATHIVSEALRPSWPTTKLPRFLVSIYFLITKSHFYFRNRIKDYKFIIMVITEMAGVVSVFPNLKRRLHTTHSWDFMGQLISMISWDFMGPSSSAWVKWARKPWRLIPGYSNKNQVNFIFRFIDIPVSSPFSHYLPYPSSTTTIR